MRLPRIPQNVTKVLIYCRDPRISAWKLGEFRLYQETHKLLGTAKDLNLLSPAIVQVRYEKVEDVLEFIKKGDLKAIRLFKTARYRKDKPPLGFFYTAGKNLLGLFSDTKKQRVCFKISSPINDLRDTMYKVAVEINEEFSFGHTFDYDKYDINFVLRDFKDGTHKMLVTYFYGKEYPNIKLI